MARTNGADAVENGNPHCCTFSVQECLRPVGTPDIVHQDMRSVALSEDTEQQASMPRQVSILRLCVPPYVTQCSTHHRKVAHSSALARTMCKGLNRCARVCP